MLEKPKKAIDILKDYCMVGEGKQWTLYRYSPVIDKVTKEKKYEWLFVGFYTCLTQVFEKCVDEELKLCSDVQEIVKRLNELQRYFKSKLEMNWDD